jgi:hypothetical protein
MRSKKSRRLAKFFRVFLTCQKHDVDDEEEENDADIIIKMALQEARTNCSRRNP